MQDHAHLTTRDIRTGELQPLVEGAFRGDRELGRLFYATRPVHSVRDMARQVVERVQDYGAVECFCVSVRMEPVGFFVVLRDEACPTGVLVSFGLAVRFRKRKYLEAFFAAITEVLGGDFICVLYQRNQRAVEWLKRCGMQVCETWEDMVTLSYKKMVALI